jgi:PAS domain S-box-containing protein
VRDNGKEDDRLRLILEGALDYAIITTDANGRITGWSAGAEVAFRLSAAEAVGRAFEEIFTPEDRAAGIPQREMTTAARRGCAENERWHERADGTRVFMNGTTRPLPRDEQGRERGFIKIARDETKQREQAEELARTRAELSESEARYRSLFNSIGAGFCVVEVKLDEAKRPVDYRFIEVNPAFERFTGLRDAEGRWMREMEPAHEQHWFDIYGRVALTGEPLRFEQQAAALGRWYDVHAYRIGAPEERHVAILFNDITDRKRAEAALEESEDHYRHSVELNPQTAWTAAPDGQLDHVGGRWFEWTGTSGLGSTWAEGLHLDDRERTFEVWGRSVATGEPYDIEHRVKLRDGSYRWMHSRAYPRRDMVGRIVKWYGTTEDIHERKLAEAALRDLNAELERRVADEVAVRARTEEALRQAQKMEAIGQLTGGVAHDFNNLLTVIRSSADLLRSAQLTEERRRRYIDAIAGTADRAARLTSQLLAFSRRQALKPEVFDAAARVRGIAEMLRTVLGARIELRVEARCAPCLVDVDPAQFETALVNLAVNARDAMAGEGRLAVTLDEAGGSDRYLAISVADDGAGIPAEILPRIFEPFFTTKEVGKGTGLGLSQVYGFVKQSGGEIDVRSKPGEGTTIVLQLPRAERAGRPAASPARPLPAAPRGRVLVVEDNPEVRGFATELLADLGYETDFAGDAAAALRELEATDGGVDLVFSDVVMPGMSGVELAVRIRERWPGIAVVLTSGYSDVLADDARHGFPVLQKPYSIEDLSRILAEASVRRSATVP